MTDITISGELAQKLQELAARQQRTVEDVLAGVVEQVQRSGVVFERIEDDPRYQAALNRLRPDLFREARQYWQQVGDQQRFALTDAELSERFWLIDLDGIPRLKGDEAHLDANLLKAEHSLDDLWLAWQRGETEFPTASGDDDLRRIMNEEFVDYLSQRMQSSEPPHVP